MTATLSPPDASGVDVRRPRPRPLALLASVAGLSAALVPLVGCLAVALAGWFLADGGVHGSPRDALRVGTTGWLTGHGSGLDVRGVAVTVVPLGLTLLAAWSVWRAGLRLGESVAGHGPDADALADGHRDWTVAAATAVFAATYLLVAVVAVVLAGASSGVPGPAPVLLWTLALTVLVGGPRIAIGSGRASVWVSLTPQSVRATAQASVSVLLAFLAAAGVAFVAALAADLGAAVNVVSRLHTDTGDAVVFSLLVLTLVPNAVLCAAAYLLGPGFTVGTGTLVSPSLVATGEVPMFPLLAALPDNGQVPPWTPYLVVVPVLCAAVGAYRAARRLPVATTAWDEGALRGVVAGVLAGVALAGLAALAGGAAGPGRMSDVGPLAGQVLFHAIVSLGIGGLLGGLASVWRTRRLQPTDD